MRGNCNSAKNNISILTNIHHHHMFLSLLALLKGNVKRELNKFKARPRVYNLCCRITSLVSLRIYGFISRKNIKEC